MGQQLSKNKGGYVYLENPKEELMQMLVDRTLAIGHMLSFQEAREDPEMVNPNNYAFYYGSFGDAARIAWNKAIKPHRNNQAVGLEKTINIPKSLKPLPEESNSKPHKGNPNGNAIPTKRISRSKRESRTRKYTYEDVKQQIIDFYKENGRLPTQVDVSSNPDLPCWGTLYRFLGHRKNWHKIVEPESQNKDLSETDCEDEEATPLDDAIQTGESPIPPIALEDPDDNTSDTKPVINTKYHWEGDILQVDVRVVKPGSARPVYVTLSV